MGTYIYKLDGKTKQVIDLESYSNIQIATAPYFTKPGSEGFQWLNTIEDYKRADTTWMTSVERAEMRKHELHHAGIFESNHWYDEDKARYFHFKRKILNAARIKERLEKQGVKYVVFGKLSEIEKYPEMTVYELNDGFWFDEPDYGTPRVGVIQKGRDGKYRFYPDKKKENDSSNNTVGSA